IQGEGGQTLTSAVQLAIILREELSWSSRFLRLSAIQSLTVSVTVAGCAFGRFVDTVQGSSGVTFRLIILITILLSLEGWPLSSVKNTSMTSCLALKVH